MRARATPCAEGGAVRSCYADVVALATLIVEPLARDALTLAQCMAIDAGAFPFPSMLFERAALDPRARVWVARAEPGGRAIGVLGACVHGRELAIRGIAVAPEQRRTGAGRALLRAAIAAAPRLGARAVVLQVSTTNAAAIALYRGEGFVTRRRREAYYAQGIYPGTGDALEMALAVEGAGSS